MFDKPKFLQLVMKAISIIVKETQPTDDRNQEAFCNITYVF